MRKLIGNMKGILCILSVSFILTGCSETELEERCFPMLAAAGYEDNQVTFGAAFPRTGSSGDSTSSIAEIKVPMVSKNTFEKSKKEYESHLNKLADYNHLKVFVMDEDLLQDTESYNKMLDYLAETEDFPRNTYVCVVDDVEELFEIEDKLPHDLGTYLEEYISKHEEAKSHILTLGDLLDEKENQTMILYMPYLEVEENYVEWGGYVNILGEIWQDF